MTLAEVSPFVIVTNERFSPAFWRRLIVDEVGRVIDEETSSKVKVAWLAFVTT